MSTEEILNLFTEDKCKNLERRAKIVIIQACRGNQMRKNQFTRYSYEIYATSYQGHVCLSSNCAG